MIIFRNINVQAHASQSLKYLHLGLIRPNMRCAILNSSSRSFATTRVLSLGERSSRDNIGLRMTNLIKSLEKETNLRETISKLNNEHGDSYSTDNFTSHFEVGSARQTETSDQKLANIESKIARLHRIFQELSE